MNEWDSLYLNGYRIQILIFKIILGPLKATHESTSVSDIEV